MVDWEKKGDFIYKYQVQNGLKDGFCVGIALVIGYIELCSFKEGKPFGQSIRIMKSGRVDYVDFK